MRNPITALALLACLSALSSAPLAAQSPSVGVVDMERVAAEYRAMQQLNRQFQDFQRQQETLLQRHQRAQMLADSERQEYFDLLDKSAPTQEAANRIASLERLSAERSRTLTTLRETTDRTPEQDQELERLAALHERRTDELLALHGAVEQTVLAKYEELSKIITDSVNAAVKQTAEAKGLTLVLRKEVVLFGGADITDDVLARLNESPAG